MEEKKLWTFEEFMAAMTENAKKMTELRELQEKTAKGLDKVEKMQEENAKGFAELRKSMKEMSKELGGIGRSNGEVAEEYFFNSLSATKTLGGVHFDSVEKNWKSSISLENGKTLDGEYDIVLINKDSMGIVEVKFKVHRKDVENLAKKQVESFKRIFPNYAKYKFYLGIGSMSFNKQAEDEAKKLGVAIFKLNGDAVEIIDKNLKVY
ncbi:MAG: hypothetical protein FWF51_06810 [Chitinivibrionia bacterium]|nr:hypothetical protein [Chitinivibrionia bacterium]